MGHPHTDSSWHDGHTSHHTGKPTLIPSINGVASPRNEGPEFSKLSVPFGSMGPSSDNTNPMYGQNLPEIDKLVKAHGYKQEFFGGKHGNPDFANKNYNTGHLYLPHVTDGTLLPEVQTSRGWHNLHELAHSLTLPEVNRIYDEGKRNGKLGTNLDLHDSSRALHWEYLAMQKQRELAKSAGIHLTDEEFNKDLNSVMADSLHRLSTGVPSSAEMGRFTPHGHSVPLATAMSLLKQEGMKRGLNGLAKAIIYYTKNDRESSVSEKEFTENEAASILMKAAKDKIAAFEVELRALRKSELSKSASIPPHEGHEGIAAGGGTEDIPSGKLKNSEKSEESSSKEESSGESSVSKTDLAAAGSIANSEKSASECEDCGKKDCKCVAKKEVNEKLCKLCKKDVCKCMAKEMLVDAKGKTTESGIVTPFSDKVKDVKNEGSGGDIKKGKGLKKSLRDLHKSMLTKSLSKAMPFGNGIKAGSGTPAGPVPATKAPTMGAAPKAPTMKVAKPPVPKQPPAAVTAKGEMSEESSGESSKEESSSKESSKMAKGSMNPQAKIDMSRDATKAAKAPAPAPKPLLPQGQIPKGAPPGFMKTGKKLGKEMIDAGSNTTGNSNDGMNGAIDKSDPLKRPGIFGRLNRSKVHSSIGGERTLGPVGTEDTVVSSSGPKGRTAYHDQIASQHKTLHSAAKQGKKNPSPSAKIPDAPGAELHGEPSKQTTSMKAPKKP
jgi:hypothetical protein